MKSIERLHLALPKRAALELLLLKDYYGETKGAVMRRLIAADFIDKIKKKDTPQQLGA